MCLAIAANPGKVIHAAHIRAGWGNNQDGGGYAYRDASYKVRVKKWFKNADEMVDSYHTDYLANDTSAFLMHFRYRTHGYVDKTNCHPFKGKYGAFVHNGVIQGLGGEKESDTLEFASYIHDMPERALVLALPELGTILGWNKLAFLGAETGSLILTKEASWTLLAGVYYSNGGFRPRHRDIGGMSYVK